MDEIRLLLLTTLWANLAVVCIQISRAALFITGAANKGARYCNAQARANLEALPK